MWTLRPRTEARLLGGGCYSRWLPSLILVVTASSSSSLPPPTTLSFSYSKKLSHVRLLGPRTCHVTAPCLPPFGSYTRPITATETTPVEMADQARGDKEKRKKLEDGAEEALRHEFLQVLRERRSPEVELTVEEAKPVKEPLFQDASPPKFSEAMAACPKKRIEKDSLKEENLYLFTEAGEQGRVPLLILSLKEKSDEKRPAVVFLHSTNKNKEWLRPLLEGYASRGYVAIAIDSRYHGERATTKTTYRDALILAWKNGDTMPFIFDTAWDLIKLADYVAKREDIDQTKIGITGESLGGMHAWFAAFADTRYAVVVPVIGVQGFRWAIDNNMWQGRVDSIKPVFEEACSDLGKTEIDKEVVVKVWNRIAPGLDSIFDSPHSIPVIAPRPLLILNGADDPRCPLAGLEEPISKASIAYGDANSLDKFKLVAQPGIGHQMTPLMVIEASNWFDKFFQQ